MTSRSTSSSCGASILVSALLLTLAPALLTGCASNFASSATFAASGAVQSGRVVGGQQPIGGASVSLYAAGAAGNGLGAVNLLRNPVLTDADGGFSLTSDYTCPTSSTQVYLLSRGGNPGLTAGTNNAAAVMMAALGDCGNLSASTFTNINEVTTVAAAWALNRFLGVNASIGASASNANGLRNAFLVAANLADTPTGTSPGSSLPFGATVETAKIATLANALSTCVNSNGSALCSPLFSAATANGVVPSNTLDAAIAIARSPAANIASIFGATIASPPFQPALAKAPKDWTVSITYKGGGISAPTAIALDSNGSLWVANYFGSVASKISAAGVPASATGFADSALNESYGLAVDGQDNAWITNEETTNGVNSGFGSISKFSSSGQLLSGSGFSDSIYYPYAIASDSNGTIWVADEGRSEASLLSSSGTSLIGSGGYTSVQIPLPVGVAIDASHNAWFTGQNMAAKVTPAGAITGHSCCGGSTGIAIDQNGSIWISDYYGSSVVQLDASGTLLQTLTATAGVQSPQALAIDGAGTVWVANFHANSVSALGSANSGVASAALSPAYGFGTDSKLLEPFSIAIDASGNVWVANFAGNSVTQLVGAAIPVKTPMQGPPSAP